MEFSFTNFNAAPIANSTLSKQANEENERKNKKARI